MTSAAARIPPQLLVCVRQMHSLHPSGPILFYPQQLALYGTRNAMHIAAMTELCSNCCCPTAFGHGTGRKAELFANDAGGLCRLRAQEASAQFGGTEGGRWIGCFEQSCRDQFAPERFGSRAQAERPLRSATAPASRLRFASKRTLPSAAFCLILR